MIASLLELGADGRGVGEPMAVTSTTGDPIALRLYCGSGEPAARCQGAIDARPPEGCPHRQAALVDAHVPDGGSEQQHQQQQRDGDEPPLCADGDGEGDGPCRHRHRRDERREHAGTEPGGTDPHRLLAGSQRDRRCRVEAGATGDRPRQDEPARDGESQADVIAQSMADAKADARMVDGVLMAVVQGSMIDTMIRDNLRKHGQEWMIPGIRPLPYYACYETRLALRNPEAVLAKPTTAVHCLQVPWAQKQYERMIACDNFWEIDTVHGLMIAEPEKTAELLLRLGEAADLQERKAVLPKKRGSRSLADQPVSQRIHALSALNHQVVSAQGLGGGLSFSLAAKCI